MKLPNAKLVTLQRLAAATASCVPKTRSDQINLSALRKLGLASRQLGYPRGYLITLAGRDALEKERGDG